MSTPVLTSPGARHQLVQAPRFPKSRSLADRLEQNDGTSWDGTRTVARDRWRSLEEAEVSRVLGPSREGAIEPEDLALFQIPERMRSLFWAEVERDDAQPSEAPPRAFGEVVELLRFKKLPVPAQVGVQISATLPGLVSGRPHGDGEPGGLGVGDPRVLAWINLGDEPSWVVLLDLPTVTLGEHLAGTGARPASGASVAELQARFFESFPDHPLLRIRLEPGDGLWFPRDGLIHDGWTRERKEVDVALQLVELPGTEPCDRTPERRQA